MSLVPAFALVLLAAEAPAGARPAPEPDPCRAARAPLPAAPSVPPEDRSPIDAYRAAWRRACEPSVGPTDLGALFGDAEALTADVGTAPTLEALAAALEANAAWPFPGIRRELDEPLEVDWAAFAAAADRCSAEDMRFWRGAVVAAGPGGAPAWLGPLVPGGLSRCLRLAEVRWDELAEALDTMERAGAEPYVRHARGLRASLLEALSAVARGPEVCACLPGDGAAALAPLVAGAAPERLGTPGRRAVAKAASEALDALRRGRTAVRVLQEAPGAPPTGCGAAR